MADYKKESQFGLIVEYFRNNPGLMISVAYLLLTLCGIFYSDRFYGEFGIVILKLADISDFLTAGISDPAALVMFGGGIIVAWTFDKMSQFSYGVKHRWINKPKSFSRTIILLVNYVPKSNLSVLVGLISIFVTYAFLFITLYADWRGGIIKQGGGDKISMQTRADDKAYPFTLLGSTSNYLLVYNTKSELAKIVPIDHIVAIIPSVEQAGIKEHSSEPSN